jgi:hypothetical protein
MAWALAAAAAPARVKADDRGTFKLDSAQGQVGTTDGTLQATIVYDSDGDNFDGWLAGLTAKVPTSNAGGDAETRLDEFTADWRIGASLGKEWALVRDKMRVQLEPEWGFKEFRYYPGLAAAPSSAVRHSFAIGGSWIYYREPEASAPMAFQVKARLASDWSAAQAVGVVTPPSGGLPPLVRVSEIIDGPVEQPSVTARLFAWRELGMGSAWAVGASAAMVLAGALGHSFSFDTTDVLRGELWLYYLPPTGSPANVRLGVAPFVDGFLAGESGDHRTVVPGALFQARYGAPVFVY